MAANFTAASSQGLFVNSTPVTAAPFTQAIWFNPNNATSFWVISGILDKDSINDRWMLFPRGDIAGDPLSLLVDDTSYNTTNGFTASAWNSAVHIETSSTDRRCVLNGDWANSVTGADSLTVAADRISAGYAADSTPGAYFDGLLAEQAVWNVALDQAEVEAYHDGVSPRLIRPSALVFHAPMVRALTKDEVGGLTYSTVGGGPSVAAHARIITPSLPQIITAPSAAAPAAAPVRRNLMMMGVGR